MKTWNSGEIRRNYFGLKISGKFREKINNFSQSLEIFFSYSRKKIKNTQVWISPAITVIRQ